MIISKKQNGAFIAILFQLFLAVLITLLFYSNNYIYVRNILLLTYVECVILSLLISDKYIFKIFLASVFLFNLANPFFEYLGLYNFPDSNLMLLGDGISTPISNFTLVQAYKYLTYFLLGASVGWLCFILFPIKFKSYNTKYLIKNPSVSFEKLIYISYSIVYFLTFLRSLAILYYSTKYGYVDVIHSHKTDLPIPVIFDIFELFYKVFGLLFISFYSTKESFVKRSLIFIIPFAIMFFAGSRGELISVSIVLLMIYSYHISLVSFKRLVVISCVFFIGAIFIGTIRFQDELDMLYLIDNFLYFMIFHFVGNASSLGVICYSMQLNNSFANDVPFLFGYIDGIFSLSPNYSLEGIQNKNYLAQHLTYHLNEDKLFGGSTIGTAQLAEFYEFSQGNILLIFFLSCLLLYASCLFLHNILTSGIILYIGYTYLEFFVLSPRGSVMKFINKESMLILIFLVLFTVVSLTISKPIKRL